VNFRTIKSATWCFVRTRVGLNSAPTLRGLIRHIEATMALHDAFVQDKCSGKWMRFMAFVLYRRMLVLLSDVIPVWRNA
jgi:hypothetical protein